MTCKEVFDIVGYCVTSKPARYIGGVAVALAVVYGVSKYSAHRQKQRDAQALHEESERLNLECGNYVGQPAVIDSLATEANCFQQAAGFLDEKVEE